MERRLAAILAADVVGYSRLMGKDEAGTVTALRRHRETLIEPTAARHHGRIIKLMGDGVLMEFASVVDAVTFALEVQLAMGEHNRELPDERALRFRIGINIGDVIVDGADIYGDGVNVAARLEGLAEPGGICISRNVRNQVRDKLDIGLEDLGEVEVKNIARPVRAFRLLLDERAQAVVSSLAAPEPKRIGRRWPLALAALIAAAVIAGAAAWYAVPLMREQPVLAVPTEQTPEQEASGPGPPSVAFAGFEAAEGAAAAAQVAATLADRLMADLSRSTRISITDVIGDRGGLSARYLMDGAVGADGGETTVNLKLVADGVNRVIWSESYDIDLEGPGAVEPADRIALDVFGALLAHAAAERETESPRAAAAFVRGWHHYHRYELWADQVALAAFNDAVALDPGYRRAHAALAALYWRCWLHRCGGDGRHMGLASWGAVWGRAEHHVERAMEENSTALAHQVASRMLQQQGLQDEALAEAEQAAALEPNNPDAFATLAEVRTIAGSPREALMELQRAQGTDLARSRLYPRALGRALFAANRFSEALIALERAVALQPADMIALELLTASYGHLGRAEEASASAAALTELVRRHWGNPHITYRTLMAEFTTAAHLPADRALLLDGLRLAGIPD
jgi:adenylate cyclase